MQPEHAGIFYVCIYVTKRLPMTSKRCVESYVVVPSASSCTIMYIFNLPDFLELEPVHSSSIEHELLKHEHM